MSTYPDRFDRLHKALVTDAAQHPTYPEGSEALAGYSEGAERALDTIRRERSRNGDNTHIATAKFRQEGVHEWQSDEGSTDATHIAAALDAQTEATLALAYEQRTANLIAYQGSKEAPYMIDLDAAALNKVIIERLGLA